MPRCSSRSPLVHSGTTQDGRDLAELRPDFFRVDERDLADLVLYARSLSRELVYYGPDNQPDGDWEAFFASDVTATLAALARLPVDPFRAALADAEEFLRDEPARPEPELRAYFNLVFHLPVALFGALAANHARLDRDHPMHGLLGRLVADDLAGPLTELVRFAKGAVGAGLPLGDPEPPLDGADYGTGGPGDLRPRLSDTVAAVVLVPEVLTQRVISGPAAEALGAADWASFAAGITGDATPYQQAAGPNLLYEQIYDALAYNLLSTPLERVFQGLERARREAEAALARSLEASDHAPHYGLWLAFLSMLGVARDQLNDLTARHLDLYLGEVLRMAPRPPEPASVHLLFELARGVKARALEEGTPLRAGKDATGREVEFRLADDLVVNPGKVAELRAVRVHSAVSGGVLHQTVFASPVARSSDGLGEQPVEEGEAWPPFGPVPYPEGATDARAPFGRVGFAVADRRLFLREGTRSVLLGFELDAPLPGLTVAAMQVRLTAPDGWHQVPGLLIGPVFQPSLLVAVVALDGDQPPVVPFDPEIHGEEDGGGYEPGLPVAELVFDFEAPDDVTARAFARLRTARVESSFLLATASGLRSLSFLTPDGAADPAKPFPAFGARPRAGAALVIGSAEIFAKPLSSLSLDLSWEDAYSSTGWFRALPASSYNCDVSFLSGGSWRPAAGAVSPHIDLSHAVLTLPDLSPAGTGAEMTLADPAFGRGFRTGFLRLELGADFGHEAYPAELTRATVAMARGITNLGLDSAYNYAPDPDGYQTPKLPYTPTIREITASYRTTADAPSRLYHVAPFGQAAVAPAGTSLLPPMDYEAALFVGVDGFAAPARLSLLVQVANGSGDPLLEVPPLDLRYLVGDAWTAFAEQEVDDKTGSFAASAVLGLALPAAADADHSLMPSGLHWVRIAAPSNAAAVNSLIAVEAQAARALFADRGNDPQLLAEPLAAGTVTRLTRPDPKIRKVRQPFVSFGGRPREDAASFRRRAAERLRHKDRASTIWDYEHLVLEAAPELFRVKCLSHTELVREAGKVVADNELSPGAVVVVTVPWTVGRPHLDPLRPYTDQATLKKVRELLAARISPFVRLEVANPKFEEVQVSFKVAFLEGIDDVAFYLGELEQAVIGHLAPWSVGEGEDITFGGRLRKSTVIDFVEELPYVDYLEDFEMYHRPDPDLPAWTPADMETIEATTARSILVSARTHLIEELV